MNRPKPKGKQFTFRLMFHLTLFRLMFRLMFHLLLFSRY